MADNATRNNQNRNQSSLLVVRDRFFHAMYFKAAIAYARIFPKSVRRGIELLILFKALLFFAVLVYLHVNFLKTPSTCLNDMIDDWPRNGVLRVEIVPEEYGYDRFYMSGLPFTNDEHEDLKIHWQNKFRGIGPKTKSYYLLEKQTTVKPRNEFIKQLYTNKTLYYYYDPNQKMESVDISEKEKPNYYIVEYSLEYGFLRLSHETRRNLRIPVYVVRLDPNTNKCFKNTLSRFLLKEFVGYDDLLMSSVRVIAEKENHRGYLRNVITGEHYRFVSMWWAAWSSYPTALCVMILFTISISMLLRYSHHQIFVFIVDLLQMLEFNSSARFPFASLLTVILALVGMEAIMSEFFNDTSTAFYIILIVWIADQYDAICCHTSITKRHWLRFFYLYHFLFYAYHYRFNGQYSNLALVASWLFIQHSMFYFFHHYELPVIIQQAQFFQLPHNVRAQNNNNVNVTNNNNLVNNTNLNNGGRNRSRFWLNFMRAGRPSQIMRMNVTAIFAQIQQRQNQQLRRQQQSQQAHQSDYQVNSETVPPQARTVDSTPTSRAQDLNASPDRVQQDDVQVISHETPVTSSSPSKDLIVEKEDKEQVPVVAEETSSNLSQSEEIQNVVASVGPTEEGISMANSDTS